MEGMKTSYSSRVSTDRDASLLQQANAQLYALERRFQQYLYQSKFHPTVQDTDPHLRSFSLFAFAKQIAALYRLLKELASVTNSTAPQAWEVQLTAVAVK